MRKITFLMVLVLTAMLGFSQEAVNLRPTKVSKAVAFDKTIPLRDMKVILPGEKDRSWKDGIIKNEFVAPPTNDSEFTTDPVIQTTNGTTATRGFDVNVDGTGSFGGAPADTDGDVGPNHYMQMINLSLRILDKEGNLLYGPVDNSTLWDGFIGPWTGHNDGDPIVMYDEKADRWIATQFAINAGSSNYELIAVSVTGDPTGEWYRYAFEYDDLNDYPKFGVWEDAYYCTYNMFGASFVGAAVAAYDREAMLNGNPDAGTQFWQLTDATYGILPADCDGTTWAPTGSPHYLAHLKRFGGQRLQIYECNVDWNNPDNSSLDLAYELTPESYSNAVSIEQPNTNVELDNFAGQLMYRLQYMNFGTHESMVCNHVVNANGRAGIRWYELRKSGDEDWTIYQQGTYSPDEDNRWMASICMDVEGNMAMGYTVSSSDVYPSIRYTGRYADSPLGKMDVAEVEIVTGSSSQTFVTRWGDYASTSPDPSQAGRFWHTNEYMSPSGNWRTRIAAFSFDPPLAPEANAGEDMSICSNEAFTTSGTAENASFITWTTSGDGEFQPNNSELEVNYIRGEQDIENGAVTLTLTATGFGNSGAVSDDMVLSISPEPIANAGADTIACIDQPLQLASSVENASAIFWFTNGDGSFNNNNIASPVYNPGANDYANGVTLTVSASPMDGCIASDTDSMRATFQDCIGIEDIAENASFEVIPNPVNGPFDVIIKGVTAKNATLTISTMKGEVIFTEMIASYQGDYSKTFDPQQFSAGIYLVTITSGNVSETKKLIITK